MRHALRALTRPLTDVERTRIEKARDQIREGTRERNIAVYEAFVHRANVNELAAAAGCSRETIYRLVERGQAIMEEEAEQ